MFRSIGEYKTCIKLQDLRGIETVSRKHTSNIENILKGCSDDFIGIRVTCYELCLGLAICTRS